MSTFTRDMRYDTKKPGPTYMIHEDEDGETSEVSTVMDFNTYNRDAIDNDSAISILFLDKSIFSRFFLQIL